MSSPIKVLCPQCYKLLCMRIIVHDEKGEQMLVHIRHRTYELYTSDVVIRCPSCSSVVRVNGNDGIIEKLMSDYGRRHKSTASAGSSGTVAAYQQ